MFNSKLKKEIDDKDKRLRDLINQYKELDYQKRELEQLYKDLQDEFENFNSKTENSVTFEISDDLTTTKPIVRYKESALEKLLELGYIRETGNEKHDAFAIQLALMDITREAISQLLESFSEAPKDQ